MKTLFIIGVGAGMFLAATAFGQERHDFDDPGHWYDWECCSQEDCAAAPVDGVRITDEGVLVQLDQGDHQFVFSRFEVLVPWGDERIRNSKDFDNHVCLYPPMHDFGGPDSDDARLLCVYIAAVF